MTHSPDVGFPYGDPCNAYPSLPLSGDDISLGQGLSTCLTRRTQYPFLSQDSCHSPSCIANSNHCPMQDRKHSSFYQHLNSCLWGGMMRGLRMLVNSAAWTWLSNTAYTLQNEMQLFSSCCTIHVNSLFSLGPQRWSPFNQPQNRVKHLKNPETNTSMDLQPYFSLKVNKIYLYIFYFEQLEQKFLTSVNVLRVHNLPVYVIDEDIKQQWFQHSGCPEGHHSWLVSIWTLSYWPSVCDHKTDFSSTRQSHHHIHLPSSEKDVVGYYVKGLTEV